MVKANSDVRAAIREAGVKQWQVAEKLNINEGTLTRKLRRELPDDEKRQVMQAINEIRSGR